MYNNLLEHGTKMKFNLDMPALIAALLGGGWGRICVAGILTVITICLIVMGWCSRGELERRLLLAVSALSFLGGFIAAARVLLYMVRHADAAMQWNPVVAVAYAIITYTSLSMFAMLGWIALEIRNKGGSNQASQVTARKLAEPER
jgi:Ni,Fe-hydrogenase I cytochrome b subunit